MTDADLVRLARDGQREAREQFVRRWSPRVLAVCRARIGRGAAAEDLAQETLLRGLMHLDTLQDPQKVGAWLRGIAVRVCLDWLRGRSRRERPLSAETADAFTSPAEEAYSEERTEQLEQQEHVRVAIEALPPELREPLLLFYFDEMTYDQIGEMLGMSRATVNSRLAKARSHLTRQLAHLTR